jgi:hypothetical protein
VEETTINVIRRLNEETAEYAADSESGDLLLRLPWVFLCECGDPDCMESIELTQGEYRELRQRGERLLAGTHGANGRPAEH